MAQQFLGLSLFIILLSFFMILNALSDYEDAKAAPVLKSLELAFAGRATGHETEPLPRQNESDKMEKGDALDQIKSLFTARIKTFEASKNRLGTQMYVRIPLEKFERLLKAALMEDLRQDNAMNKKGGKFLPTLISLMDTEKSGPAYRMDILLEMARNPATLHNETPQELDKILRKISAFTQALETAGMPKKRISAGLKQKQARTKETGPYIELLFRRYIPIDPTAGMTLEDLNKKNG